MEELFQFTLQDEVYHRYTSGIADVYFEYKTYLAVPIERSALANSEEPLADQVVITVPKNNTVAQLFIGSSPNYSVPVRISHLDDAGDEIVDFVGYLSKVSFKQHEAAFSCSVTPAVDGRNILPRRYQAQCAHALYSTQCGVNKALYAEIGYVSTVNGSTLVSPLFATHADGYFIGGMVLMNEEYRTVLTHVGNTITVLGKMPDVVAGNVVTSYPGCPHTIAACDSLFGNSANYGGQNLIPTKNPFTQSIGY